MAINHGKHSQRTSVEDYFHSNGLLQTVVQFPKWIPCNSLQSPPGGEPDASFLSSLYPADLAAAPWSSSSSQRCVTALTLKRWEFLFSVPIAVSYRRHQPSHSQGWKSAKWWSTCRVSRWKISMARRITGVCALPGATWEPPRAARRPCGSPVSDLYAPIDLKPPLNFCLCKHAGAHFKFFLPLL